jgi:hypothetical protein
MCQPSELSGSRTCCAVGAVGAVGADMVADMVERADVLSGEYNAKQPLPAVLRRLRLGSWDRIAPVCPVLLKYPHLQFQSPVRVPVP